MHLFAYLNNDIISCTYEFQNKIFPEAVVIIAISCFHLSRTSSHLHPLQVENCDSNSRLVMDEDDNGKFRLERVYNTCQRVVSTTFLMRQRFVRALNSAEPVQLSKRK